MKILHVITSVDPKFGGPIEGIKQLYPALVDLGVKIEIVCSDAPDAPWLATSDMIIHTLGPAFLKYGYTPRLLPWLRKNAPRFDAVIVNGIWQYHSFATRQALVGTGVPYFVFTHGMLDPWFKHAYPFKHMKKWLYWPWAEYRVLRDARAVFFTTEDERVLARQSFWLYRSNEVVVNYGTKAPMGDATREHETFYSAYPQLRNKRMFLFLSRIHPKKGCDILIEAFAQVAKQDARLHLVMAGPDQEGWQKELIRLSERLGVADKITWTGMLSGKMKWGAYHAAEAFVLPSHSENFGIVVAESLACGTPVLISDKVNIWREIDKAGAGIVMPDTLEGAVSLFNTWLHLDNVDKSKMRKNSVSCFTEHFEIKRAAETLVHKIRQHAKFS